MKSPKMNSHLLKIQMFDEVPKNELTSIKIQMFHEVPKNELTSIKIQMLHEKPHKRKNKSLRKFPKMNSWNKKFLHQFSSKVDLTK
jgi:hypothetical protein